MRIAGRSIPVLDAIRGIAAIMVFVYHGVSLQFPLWGEILQTYDYGWLLIPVAMGWSGVDLFFVLSGFLITGILLDTVDERDYFRNFYARRTLRIFPLYYGLLVAIFLLLPLVDSLYTIPQLDGHGSLSKTIASTALVLDLHTEFLPVLALASYARAWPFLDTCH